MTQKSSPVHFAFACPLASGLHARPASHLAEVANRFHSECSLTNLRNNLTANAKSVLGIIAADVRYGDRCSLQVAGTDEGAALTALQSFVEDDLPFFETPVANVPFKPGTIPPRSLQVANVVCIFGSPVSRGIGEGKVAVLKRSAKPESVESPNRHDPQQELQRVRDAIAAVRHRISARIESAVAPTETAVLQADLAIAGDVLLLQKLTDLVRSGKSAAQAVSAAGDFFSDLLGHSENDYIRQRSADIEEICQQLMEEVGEIAAAIPLELREPAVLVAATLGPQQLLQLDRRYLKAIVLEQSGDASHAAILARSLGIPTLAGVKNASHFLAPGQYVLVDALRGFVVPEISPAVRRFYEREQETLERRKQNWSHQSGKAAVTFDGTKLEVAANAASADELTLAFENGADGIGLFRTEMLFLGRDAAPSEDEQFAVYSTAARVANRRPVIIRTFDIGGDKKLPYLNLPPEDNPFLGVRGFRVYAARPDLLQTQLRAILRASMAGTIQIMAPMISALEEIVQFKAAINLAGQLLIQSGVPFQPDVKIGIMLEVPSAAFILHQLCEHVDFFSIGTNDLSQYFFATDRGNPALSSQFTVRHPGFLRFLKQSVSQIHQEGKWVGMCGEMAAEVKHLPLLLGLGLDEISVPASDVQDVKRKIATYRTEDSVRLLDRAIACDTTAEVDLLLLETPSSLQARSLLSDDLVLLDSKSRTKEEVMQEMVDALYISDRTDDRYLLEEALWAREAGGSTGFGHGFAIPHCKTAAVTANSICVLRLKEPVIWDSTRGECVSMVVLLALRDAEFANTTHMQVFSSLARKLINDDFRQYLLTVGTAAEITSYLAAQLQITLGET